MSIRNLPQRMLIAGICAAQATVASAETPAVAVAKPAVGAAHPRVAQAAQVPARPAALQVGSAAPGALPGASPMTLWKFMGVPQGIQKLRGATTNRRGNFPGREPKPPLKALADPANLLSGNPAIETAAKIKQQEDMKKQKIKALKYLATIGCGCYPGVKEAFMAALGDCTEAVRLQAAESIAKAADTKCDKCSKSCCCDADMMQKLNDVATARDDQGCFVEPSAEVRMAACEALMACRRRVPVYPVPVVPGPPPIGTEAQPDTAPPPGEAQPDEMPMPPNQASSNRPSDLLISEILGAPAAEPAALDKAGVPARAASARTAIGRRTSGAVSPSASAAATSEMLKGTIVGIDPKTSTVDVEFDGRRQPAVGSQFSLHHDYALSTAYLGRIEIVYLAGNGRAIARPAGRLDIAKLGKGDRVSGRIVEDDESQRETMTSVSTRGKSRTVRSCVAPPATTEEAAPYVPEEPPAPPADDTQASGKNVRSFLASWIKPRHEETAEIAASHEEVDDSSPAPTSSWRSWIKPAFGASQTPALKPQAAEAAPLGCPTQQTPALRPQTAKPARPAKPSKPRATSTLFGKAAKSGANSSTPGMVLLED